MSTPPPPRSARLVLVDADGGSLGSLPLVPVPTPWWQEVGAVVDAVRDRFGIDVTILRLLDTELPRPHGGAVTYLAEVEGVVQGLEPWPGQHDDHALRHPYARPGGPRADLAWADEILAERGLERVAPAEQIRSWNLSSLWRLPLHEQTAWLKVVPPFFAHEGALLALLAADTGPDVVPALLGHDDRGRILMAEIPGEDLYDAGLPTQERMVNVLVRLQARWAARTDTLLELGLPDWRAPALTAAIRDTVDRTAGELAGDAAAAVRTFADGLEDRFGRLAETRLPDTLVHGDFHPGNFRGGDRDVVLLDWGDSGVGHPLLDQPAFLDRVPDAHAARIRQVWSDAWRNALPGSDPERAAALIRPIAAARQAVIYQAFLDNIEPAERPYHAADPAVWLERTASIVEASETS